MSATNKSLEEIENKIIVAIHQPNYLPWLGYFYKIYASDIFIFHDNVEHSKKYPTRRTFIRKSKHSADTTWLTVPLIKHSDSALINDLLIDHGQDWEQKQLRKITNTYHHAPHFQFIYPILREWLSKSKSYAKLADLNIYLIEQLLDLLNWKKKTLRSSQIQVSGKGSDYNLALTKYVSGTVYLSGLGGINYQSPDTYQALGVHLLVSQFRLFLQKNPYPQFQGTSFLSGLSVLDALFNIGLKGINDLFDLTREFEIDSRS